MASMYVDLGEENKDHLHSQHHHHQPQSSPRQSSPKEMKRTWSANAACGHGVSMPKCVCAPATHAGSFKCRLHRVNSQGHPPAPAPQPAVSSASTRTVEAL